MMIAMIAWQKAADAEGGSKDAPASSGTGSSHAPPPSLNDNPATSKEGVKDMGKDDLQALIAARISAGKQAHAHVKKIEDAFNEKSVSDLSQPVLVQL